MKALVSKLSSPRNLQRTALLAVPALIVAFVVYAALPEWNCRSDNELLATLDWEAPACTGHGKLLQALYPLGNRDFRLRVIGFKDRDFAQAKDLARQELMREARGEPGDPGSETAAMAALLAEEWEAEATLDPDRERRIALYAMFARLVDFTHQGRRHSVEDVGASIRFERLGLAMPRLGAVPHAATLFCFVVEDLASVAVEAVIASPRLARCVADRAALPPAPPPPGLPEPRHPL